MGKSRIEWTEHSWNPLRAKAIDSKPNISKSGHYGTGCSMVSPGCNNCYAGTMNRRFYGNDYSHHSKPSEFFLDDRILKLPMQTRKPTTFFLASMCDLFHEDVPYGLISRVFSMMRYCRQHTFQVLTKRPHNMKKSLEKWGELWQMPFPNIWFGVSAENQEMADLRIPILLQIPAAVRFVSCEPLLGPIDIRKATHQHIQDRQRSLNISYAQAVRLDWAVVGGESGHGRRECKLEWVRKIVDQCQLTNTPVFVKQLQIDGKITKDIEGWPEYLRIRQMPIVSANSVIRAASAQHDKDSSFCQPKGDE